MSVDTPAWVRDAVFYQVFPDRFARSERVDRPGPLEDWDAQPTLHGFKGGDLRGVTEHLAHIAGLGANALYLTPVFESASNHRYHTYDYFTVDPLLGGNDALRELIDAAHARGMRVILDGVFNHTGRGFWPFHHVVEGGAASPYRHWFVLDAEALEAGRPLDPYPTAHARNGDSNEPHAAPVGGSGDSLARLGYQAWWDIPALPKLNVSEPAVREYLWSVAEHWLRFGADGWRLDVPGEIQDPPFWAEFRRRCRAVNPEAYIVGEIWDVAPDWTNDERFDALMNYPLAEAILGFVGGPSLNEPLLRSHHEYGRVQAMDGPTFAGRLEEVMGAYDPDVTAVQLNLMGSHDTPRLASILGGDRHAIELAVLLQATLPGAPCVYYGDEIGLRGGIDPDCRRAFPWAEDRWDHELLDFVRAAFGLRQREPLLRHGETQVFAAEDGWLAFERSTADGGEALVVVVNAGADPVTVTVAGAGAHLEVLALPGASSAIGMADGEGGATVTVPGRSGAVVRRGG
ncbi:MAG TPA: glycoside hydrolase family 13 protein [Candidatus Acidoferrales bacterium]|nr:glycoside hydrolase family 13 protein [Candidatus Acidoferrales bacterium]